MSKKTIILAIAFLILNSYAEVWKDGEFLIWSYGKKYISPADFCFALRFENEKIGNPNCFEAGDWERDTTISLYAKWLSANLDARLKSEDLRPRSPHVMEKLQNLKDKSLLFATIKNDKIWFLLFDETSLEPKKIAVFPLSQDSASVSKKIARDWFNGTPQNRLSDAQRAAKQSEPDEYYAEQPMYDAWLGINISWNQAKIPLTPNSWYKNKLNSKIRNYREVDDSTSVWRFIDDSAPVYGAYIGGSLYDFIGLEFEFRRSMHKAKINDDPIYNELERWNFNRYEFWLSLIFMTVFHPHAQIEIEPYASASVIYSIFTEDISFSGKPGTDAYDAYKSRFEFESYYRGVGLNFGLRTAFFKNYALNLRTGIANRGTSMVTQEIIGSSTTDAYVAAGLEYHFRWK
jgi:hypothetical protein